MQTSRERKNHDLQKSKWYITHSPSIAMEIRCAIHYRPYLLWRQCRPVHKYIRVFKRVCSFQNHEVMGSNPR